MTEVKNFDQVFRFMHLVVDQDRTVYEFSHTRMFSNDASKVWKTSQQFHMIQQRTAKMGGRRGIIRGNMADDLGQVFQRPLRVEEAAIHWGKSLRTSSAGMVRPASASRMPSSIAARVSLSSSSCTGAGVSKSNFFTLAIRKLCSASGQFFLNNTQEPALVHQK